LAGKSPSLPWEPRRTSWSVCAHGHPRRHHLAQGAHTHSTAPSATPRAEALRRGGLKLEEVASREVEIGTGGDIVSGVDFVLSRKQQQ
jgi:hypothetical protein